MDNANSRIIRMADVPRLNDTGRSLATLFEMVQCLRSAAEGMLLDTDAALSNAHELSDKLDEIHDQLIDIVNNKQVIDILAKELDNLIVEKQVNDILARAHEPVDHAEPEEWPEEWRDEE